MDVVVKQITTTPQVAVVADQVENISTNTVNTNMLTSVPSVTIVASELDNV